jgi:hypothetical protein
LSKSKMIALIMAPPLMQLSSPLKRAQHRHIRPVLLSLVAGKADIGKNLDQS